MNEVKVKLLKWYLVTMAFIGTFVWIIILFTTNYSYFGSDRDTADLGQHSAYIDEVAATLGEEQVYVDPLLAATVGTRVSAPEVVAAVRESDTDVFVVASSQVGYQVDVDADVFLGQVADAAGKDGMYVLVDSNAETDTLWVDDEIDQVFASDFIGGPQSAESLADAIAGIDDAVDEESGSSFFDGPLWLGAFMGATFSVPLWYFMKLIRWSMRRDRSYLKGFKQ